MAKRTRPGTPRVPPLAPDDDVRAAARHVLGAHLAAFEREAPAARGGDVEAIHQLRVATRRLRASLQLFTPVLPAATVAALAEGLAWLGRSIGVVRDLDVLGLALAGRARKLDDDARVALGRLDHAILERRAVSLDELVHVLESARARGVLRRLAQLTAPRPTARTVNRLGDAAADLVQPLLRAVQRAGRDLDEETSAVALHRLRVRVKRLRYACETFETLSPAALRPVIRRLVRLQDVLGEHQDAITQAAWLRSYAAAGQLPPATLLAMGAVIDRLERRALELRRQVPELWNRFDRKRVRAQLADAVGEPTASASSRGRMAS